MPHYDSQNGLLYLYGKGSNTIMYGEIINDDRKWYLLGKFASKEHDVVMFINVRLKDFIRLKVDKHHQLFLFHLLYQERQEMNYFKMIFILIVMLENQQLWIIKHG